MNADAWLETVLGQFQRCKRLSERATAQVSDAYFVREPSADANSLAILVQHMGGNLRSRWTDFLTTDGEKPDRERDAEFELRTVSRARIEALWEQGWRVCLESLTALTPDDLARTITIRCEPIGVISAIHRSLSHADYHCGQIVQLARHWVGDDWRSLSIPRGESERTLREMRERFGG